MAYKELKTRIKWCRDTSANWTSNDPVLLDGEIIVVDTDSGETRFKIGDGVKTYTQLPFEDEVIRNLINNKVDKVDGKGLSTNDYTTDEKEKLAGIETGAQVNVQADWEQNDDTSDSYINNRPFGVMGTTEVTLKDGTCEGFSGYDDGSGIYEYEEQYNIVFEIGKEYTVIFDGTSYNCTVYQPDFGSIPVLGNLSIVDDSLTDTGEPFIMGANPGASVFIINTILTGTSHTVTIKTNEEIIKKIDTKYLPDIPSQNTWYGTCATAAATAAKVVTTTTRDFVLKKGATVYVLFNTAHTSASRITLNVDGTGDTVVNLSSTNGMTAYQIAAKQVICFVYDGESFRVQGGSLATTQYYGLTKLSSSTSSTSTTMAATPSAVKEAYDLAAAAVSSSDIIDVAHGGTGRSTIADTEYTVAKYRASALVSTETNPTDNGVVYWMYE